MRAATAQSMQRLGCGLDNRILRFDSQQTQCSDRLYGPPSFPFSIRGPFCGGKQPVREEDNSPPFSTEVKNEWKYTCPPPYAFMVCTRTTLILLFCAGNSFCNQSLHKQKCSFRFKCVPVCKYFSFRSYHELCPRGLQVYIILGWRFAELLKPCKGSRATEGLKNAAVRSSYYKM
jgi:hypothetical protein